MPRAALSFVTCLSAVLLATAAAAQYPYPPASNPATGERYHVEVAVGYWNPSPVLLVSSESLGIIGSEIDAVRDLGVEQSSFVEFKLVLRPAKKHKFRFDYIPISYTAQAVLEKDVVFNGIKYRIGLPVATTFDWKNMHIGYEYDFLSRDMWFTGFVVGAKYTDIFVELASPIDTEYVRARAPVPYVGGIARVYFLPNVSVTGQFDYFRVPASLGGDGDYRGDYVDIDIYGTVNFVNNVGVQVGYRSLDLAFQVEKDNGTFRTRGWYLTGVFRF